MVEVLKEFLLFGVVEVVILLMFYKYVGGVKEINIIHFLKVIPFYFAFGQIQEPLVKQILIFFTMMFLLFFTTKKLMFSAKLVALSFLMMIICETVVCVLIDTFTSFDILNCDIFEKFICLILMRILEFSVIIYFYIKEKKVWGGFGMVVSKNTKKKLKKLNS